MNPAICKPQSAFLKNYIEYFLFLSNEGQAGFYKTFPNTNLCLAIYQQNAVNWDRELNSCSVSSSGTQCSRLFGFHKKPFTVTYKGFINQVCILFKVEGIAAFTNIPVNTIEVNDNPFLQVFGHDSAEVTEKIFMLTDNKKQAALLEKFLLKKLLENYRRKVPVLYALQQLRNYNRNEKNIVSWLSGKLSINPSTLYRNFLSTFGQSPYDIYKTIRFRKVLTALMAHQESFTEVAYENYFFDQSHLIKDIRQFTGEAPAMLLQKVTNVENTLVWISK